MASEEDKDAQIYDFIFKNPSKIPIEKLYLTIKLIDGNEDQIKALSKHWVIERYYPQYIPMPVTDKIEDKKAWLDNSENYIKALNFVLHGLPFYKFWSYILYEPKITKMLDSFFRYAVPPYLPQPSGDFQEPYLKIYNLVFQLLGKIFTPKESETEYITPKTLGTLLQEHNVITNYTLWDLCKFYGHIDDGTLVILFRFVYQIMPNLKEELQLTVTNMAEIFEAIGTAAYEADDPTEKLVNKLGNLLYDTAFSINMFFKIYLPYKNICVQENLYSRIIHTYDSEIPILYFLMTQVYIDNDAVGYDRVDSARVELLEICHQLLSHCMDMILQTQENAQEQNKWIEMYLSRITSITNSKDFLTDYNRIYPVVQDIEMLTLICPNVDEQKCNQIREVMKKHNEDNEKEEIKNEETVTQNGIIHEPLEKEVTITEDLVLESKVTELMDMFPDYGDGFLEQCLLAMDMDSQAVIMAILEENLPPALLELDKKLPRIPPEEPEPGPSIEAAYVGKKPTEHRNLTELLNDKSHVQEQRLRYQVYSSFADGIYDDDYDDRYDDDYTVGIDIDDAEEILKPRYRGRREESEEEEKEEEEEEEEEEDNNLQENGANDNGNEKRDQFCEDPAVIRARREQRFQQRGRKGPSTNNNTRNKDVVGKPKGQGQEKEVLKNRDKKNVNKSSRGNHNRRSGAQWKRSRGMIPS